MLQLVSVVLLLPLLVQDPTNEEAVVAADIEPTLDQIFERDGVLGQRPRRAALSADGRFVVYEWAPPKSTDDSASSGDDDADDDDEESEDDGDEGPKFNTYLVATDGGEPRLLFDAEDQARTWWTRDDAKLLVFRDGWLELHDADRPDWAQPLIEVSTPPRGLTFFEESSAIVFLTGEDSRLFVLDLDTGERFTPADHLKNRGGWFQLLESTRKFAMFANPSEIEINKGDAKKDDEGKVKRVLYVSPLKPEEDLDWETKFEEGGAVTVSADGEYALRRRTDNDVDRKLIMADYLTDQVSTVNVRSSLPGDPGPRVALELYQVQDQREITPPLDAGRYYWSVRTDWSEEGHRLLIERVSNDFHVRQILILDPEQRSARLVFSERDDAWVGGPLLWSSWAEDGGVLFTSEQSGYNHLYHHDDEAGMRALTDAEASYEVLSVDLVEGRDEVVLITNEPDPAERVVVWLNTDTAESRRVSRGEGVAERVLVSRDGSRVAWMQSFLGTPDELYAAPLDGSQDPVRLTESAPEAFTALDLPAPEIVEYESDDGQTVRAFLYRPQPFDPTQRYPAVMFIHGAGYLQNVTRSMSAYDVNMLFHHRLARKGYVVIDPDYRHSAGYGRDFRADVYGYMGGQDLDDAVAGVTYLEKLGFVDTGRVGIYGGSYGGFMVLMALFTRPEVFACGCALRSVTDWRTYNAWYTNARLGDPKDDADNYERSSPIDHADGLQRPLLLLHGLKDSNVFAQDTIRLIEKLIELRKDFDAMLYPSQNHAFTDPDSWIDEYKRIERYFDRYLKEDV